MRRLALAGAVSAAVAGIAYAGPPYLTDDPEPVPLHHWELYTFYTRDQTRSSDAVAGPALELNNGIAPNTQLHLIVPHTYFAQGGVGASGLGDTELGVKYRFVPETKNVPEIGVFPLIELPTGDQTRGLGNGRTWLKVPIWLQKSWGNVTTYGGGGYAYNSAPGQHNYFFGGDLVQYTFSPKLTLGGEIFVQGESVDVVTNTSPSGLQPAGTRATAIYNLGGSFNITPEFSILFTAGHSFQGDGNAVVYLGLYHTWGPHEAEK